MGWLTHPITGVQNTKDQYSTSGTKMDDRKPEWNACTEHAPDTWDMKIAYDMMGESPGYKFIFIKVECKNCGCPGEIVLEMPTSEITWDPED